MKISGKYRIGEKEQENVTPQHRDILYAGNTRDIQGKRMGRPVGKPASIVKKGTVDIKVVKQRIGDDHLRQNKAHRREHGSSIAEA